MAFEWSVTLYVPQQPSLEPHQKSAKRMESKEQNSMFSKGGN